MLPLKDNKISLKFGILGAPSLQSEWGWVSLKKVHLLINGKKLPYHVDIPDKVYDTIGPQRLNFLGTVNGVVHSTSESVKIPCEKIKDLQIHVILAEQTSEKQSERTVVHSPRLPANIVPGQEYHLVVLSEKGTWSVVLVKDEQELLPSKNKDQSALYYILRKVLLSFPIEPQAALGSLQQVIEEIDFGSLTAAMKKIDDLQAIQKTKSPGEADEIQAQIFRVALDLIGPVKFDEIINSAMHFALRESSALQDQYLQLSVELQKLFFDRSNALQKKEISLFFCWIGPNKVKNAGYSSLDLTFEGAKKMVSTPLCCSCSDGFMPFGSEERPLIRLVLTEQNLNSLQLSTSDQEEKRLALNIKRPTRLEWGRPYCLLSSLEGAAIISLPEFFDRNKIAFSLFTIFVQFISRSLKNELSSFHQSQFYLFIQNIIQAIEYDKVCQSVLIIEDIADKSNYKFEDSDIQSKIFVQYINLLGHPVLKSILKHGVRFFLYPSKRTLSTKESEKLEKKTNQLYENIKKMESPSSK